MTNSTKRFMYHLNTRNLSFLQTCHDLSQLGVKKNLFPMKLYDSTLSTIDPFSDDLTEEVKLRIVKEVLINPWYFLRECAIAPTQDGGGSLIVLNRQNLASIYCMLEGMDQYTIPVRHTYHKAASHATLLWIVLFSGVKIRADYLGRMDTLSSLHYLDRMINLLPDYLIPGALQRTNETGTLTMDSLLSNNKLFFHEEPETKLGTSALSTHMTNPIQFFYEFEYINVIKDIVYGSAPGRYKQIENRTDFKVLPSRTFISPITREITDGSDFATLMEDASVDWNESFYDMTREEWNRYLLDNSMNNIIFIKYDYKDLGLDEEWFEEQSKMLFNDENEISRQIFLDRI